VTVTDRNRMTKKEDRAANKNSYGKEEVELVEGCRRDSRRLMKKTEIGEKEEQNGPQKGDKSLAKGSEKDSS
jgi:hypothetical protein